MMELNINGFNIYFKWEYVMNNEQFNRYDDKINIKD